MKTIEASEARTEAGRSMKVYNDYFHKQYIDGTLKLSDEQKKKWEEALELIQQISISKIQGLVWNEMGLPRDNRLSDYLQTADKALEQIFWEIFNVVGRIKQDEIMWKHFTSEIKE